MDITENLEQVQKLDEKIATAEAELEETTEKVEILQTTIKQLEEQQKNRAKKNMTHKKEVFEQRVVALYEAGDTQYIDIILKSKKYNRLYLKLLCVIRNCRLWLRNVTRNRRKKTQHRKTQKEKLEKRKKLEVATIIERQTRTSKSITINKSIKRKLHK